VARVVASALPGRTTRKRPRCARFTIVDPARPAGSAPPSSTAAQRGQSGRNSSARTGLAPPLGLAEVRQLLSWVGKQQNSIEAKGGAVVQFSHTEEEPQCCPICEDERQYVAKGGQRC